ncbi:MAG: phenylalanine--tRNA ligase subunit beta [Gammaproteobacteria bacterium]|nr:phenylalanine--tRNA ligase subunit beta [Gammaproteobacteria bacterium]
MKLSEQWLREWIDPKLSREQLIEKLNLSGLAVESCEPYENDFVFEFELTPNRGDCLSVLGIAREIAALTHTKLDRNGGACDTHIKLHADLIPVEIKSPKACPLYIGRVIKNIKPGVATPKDIQQKLLKSGIKLIHPVVDIMNFVMIELGQPLHAFDLQKINSKVIVRQAKSGEEIVLLDNQKIKLDKNILVIADNEKPIAMAGIMGGLDSGVTASTTEIFIESAHFSPELIAGDARRYGLHTDASHRFERGVDPALPEIAIKRATELLKEIYGDLAISDLIIKSDKKTLPKTPKIKLRTKRVTELLGYEIPEKKSLEILESLNMMVSKNTVVPPSYRFDISQEVDLIEEIARVYGYEHVPTLSETRTVKPLISHENIKPLSQIKNKLVSLGYQEVVSYSFISELLQNKISPGRDGAWPRPNVLENPLSAELAVMRSSLWGSLIEIVQHNLNRQQEYLKFFETGLCFKDKEEPVLSGIWAGLSHAEQWGEKKRDVDFFDLKNTLEQLNSELIYKSAEHPALYPAQTAELFLNGKSVGFCGALHPELQKSFDINIPVFLFEIDLYAVTHKTVPAYQAISKFPSIRRDISLVMNKKVSAQALQEAIQKIAGPILQEVAVFDVYKQNIALRLLFQLVERTLVEDEVTRLMNKIIAELTQQFDVTLRT